MSHLKCQLHNRRVMVLDGRAFHRSRNKDDKNYNCATKSVKSGTMTYPVSAPFFHSSNMVQRDTAAEALLEEIFKL